MKLEEQDWVINPNTGNKIDMKKLQKEVLEQVVFSVNLDEIRIIGICENCKNSN
jgi:hypothetical protein